MVRSMRAVRLIMFETVLSGVALHCGLRRFAASDIGLEDKESQTCERENNTHRIGDGGGEPEAFRSLKDIGHADRGHESGGQRGHKAAHRREAELMKKYSACPKNYHCERLIGPGEVAPQNIKGKGDGGECADCQQGDGKSGAVGSLGLVDAEPVGNGQTAGTKRRVA